MRLRDQTTMQLAQYAAKRLHCLPESLLNCYELIAMMLGRGYCIRLEAGPKRWNIRFSYFGKRPNGARGPVADRSRLTLLAACRALEAK